MIVSADIHTRDDRTQPTLVEGVGPGVGIAPSVTSTGRLTGEFAVVNWYRGVVYRLVDEAGCVVCARRAANLATDSGVDWVRPHPEVIADPVARIVAVNVGVLLAHCSAYRDCDDLPEAATAGGYEAVRLP